MQMLHGDVGEENIFVRTADAVEHAQEEQRNNDQRDQGDVPEAIEKL